MLEGHFILKIYRGEPGRQYWEEFELRQKPALNIISCLMEIQKNPVTREEKSVFPVAWEMGCLEEVCGSCSMLINGRPRQACTALVRRLIEEGGPIITLAPMTKFPLKRDLMVDRSIMFENLKKVRGWVEADSSHDRGPGPRISPIKQEAMYTLSTCMTCGCCSEACPQVNDHSSFIGPAAVAQATLFNLHPVGKEDKAERLHFMMGDQGIGGCGNAQNCKEVCPKNIPLTDAIAAMSRDVTLQAIQDLFNFPERQD